MLTAHPNSVWDLWEASVDYLAQAPFGMLLSFVEDFDEQKKNF